MHAPGWLCESAYCVAVAENLEGAEDCIAARCSQNADTLNFSARRCVAIDLDAERFHERPAHFQLFRRQAAYLLIVRHDSVIDCLRRGCLLVKVPAAGSPGGREEWRTFPATLGGD